MSGSWTPEDFKDEFEHEVIKLVDKKVKAGDTATVIQPEEEAPGESAEVIDLTELLQRSLRGSKSTKGSAAPVARKIPSKKIAAVRKTSEET